jgi:serine/threonine protein kinase
MSMKGSGYISSGTYGCVFKKPIQCDGDKDKVGKAYTNTIGKVFKSKDSAMDEMFYQEMMQKIDPHGNFTLRMLKKCKLGKIIKADEFNKCDLDIDEHTAPQIIYDYGGKDLFSVMTTAKNGLAEFMKIFRKLRPVLVGLQKMNEMGYHHLDIKPENILWDGSKLYVIDFGLMQKENMVFTNREYGKLYFDYLYYPPEFKMWIYCQRKPKITDCKRFIRLYKRNLDSMHMFKNYELFKGVSVEQQLASYFYEFAVRTKEFKNDVVEFKNFVGKTDVFSLGMTLFMCFVNMIEDETPKTVVVRDFISRMIALNPYERYSWDILLEYYDYIMNILKEKSRSKEKN